MNRTTALTGMAVAVLLLAQPGEGQQPEKDWGVKIEEKDVVFSVGLPKSVVKGDLDTINKIAAKLTFKYKDKISDSDTTKLTTSDIKACTITVYKGFRAEQKVDELKYTIAATKFETKVFQVTGVLKVVSKPSGAQLYLDGKYIDKTDTACVVSAGKHRVVVKNPPVFEDSEEECTVEEDGVKIVTLTLTQKKRP